MPFAPECFWAFQTRATFWAIFLKNALVPPVALIQKMRVLRDLAKIAITWPFGHFWNCCLRQNLFQSLHFKSTLTRGYYDFRQSAFGRFKRGLLFGRFLKHFPRSPVSTFSENAALGWPSKNCHTSSIRALLEPPSAPKSSPIFAL